MKYSLVLLFNLIIITTFSQNNKTIENILSKENLSNSTVGVSIKTIDGKNVISYNSNLSLTPASNLKLLTTATALDILGENYQYQTSLMYNENNPHELIIKGSGDPTLGSEFINQTDKSFLNIWVAQISKKITKDKPLQILIDDSYFGYKGISNKWLYEDIGNYYAAGSYGISIFDNTYKLFLNSSDSNSCPHIVKIRPNLDIDFDNQLKTANNTKNDVAFISGVPFSNHRKIIGTIPPQKTNYILKGDIPDPGITLGKVLADALKDNGYNINEVKTIRDKYQTQFCSQNTESLIPTSIIFYKNFSPSLANIIKTINVNSNNHYTEHLIRTLGKEQNSSMFSDPLEDGIQLIKDYWSKNIDTKSLYMYDGCGLAPSNKISTDMLTNVLLYMYNNSKYSESFISSLPKAGQNGTVRNFLKGTRLEGNVYVKSGSINNVQSFSGYYIKGNKKYVFSIIVNNFNSPRKQVVRAIENILLAYIVD